jgi:hypothetical protein
MISNRLPTREFSELLIGGTPHAMMLSFDSKWLCIFDIGGQIQ